MKEDNKSSIIKEALTDYNKIMEAADANAKKKLAEEFPDKFNDLLKKEIKNKNNSNKESDKDETKESKKLDNVEKNKEESVMKNQKKETKKVVKEGDENQPFEETPKKVAVKEEREKDFMADVEGDTPNLAKGGTEDGDTFVEKITTKKETLANKKGLKEEFDLTELDVSAGTALENAENDDEVITLQEIEAEINEMEGGASPEMPNAEAGSNGGDAYEELVSMRNKLNEMIGGMGEQKTQGGKQSIPGRENGGPTQSMIDEDEVEEQKTQGGKQSIPGRENGGPTQSMIDETSPITDDDVAEILGAPEAEEMAEAHGVSFSSGTITPGKLGDNDGSRGRFRGNQNESVRVKSLIKENKKLTKNVNESKKLDKLVENYKTALDKYRNQLREMAIFNSNLAHVNNLFVNENLALTHDDKIKIINEFKQVNTIAGSQKKYKSLLSEMKESNKTLTESVETKMSTSVAPSSKQKLDEVIENTAYENNEHVQKMKKLIEYVENRGKKII